MEIRLYYSLFKSFRRKKELSQEGIYLNNVDNYNFFAKVFLFLITLEGSAVALLVPHKWWQWKLIHSILSIYAFVFVFSDYRANGLYANLINDEKLILGMGLKCRGEISWPVITGISKCSKDIPGFSLVPVKDRAEPGVLYMSAGERCNIEIKLVSTCYFKGYFKDYPNINTIYLAMEKPDEFIAAVNKNLPG